jgi:formamidase
MALAGSDDEAFVCNPEGEIVLRGHGAADETSINDALKKWQHRGLENNLYQFGHQGYIAVEEGAPDCP